MTKIVLIPVLLALLFAVRAESGSDSRPNRVLGYGQVRFNGAGPERWALRYRQARQEIIHLRLELEAQRRIVLRKPQVVEAINLACATFGYCSTLWRKAKCETGGTFDPGAHNGDSNASGLFQFLPSTWRSTPFARMSVWSPYANALAAGWMHVNGRGGEWTCR